MKAAPDAAVVAWLDAQAIETPFTLSTSWFYSELMARARASGKAIGRADGSIAATAAERGLVVATRETSPFTAAVLTVINLWNG